MTPIQSLGALPGLQSAGAGSAVEKGGSGLGDAFGKFLQKTNEQQFAADQSIQQFVEGKSDNVQQVVLAMAQAEMSFQLFMEIRNKVTETYNELMRMQF